MFFDFPNLLIEFSIIVLVKHNWHLRLFNERIKYLAISAFPLFLLLKVFKPLICIN